jgi:hypothetical protein
MTDANEGLAVAVLAGTVAAAIDIYTNNAPKLSVLRSADSNDVATAQLVLDADVLGLIVVLALGGGGAIIIHKWYPLLLGCMALLLVSAYYHSVLRSSNEGMRNDESDYRD